MKATDARATALVVFSACCFGSISIFTVLATRAGTPLWTILTWRYLAAGALLLAVSGRAALRLPARTTTRALVVGGVGQAAVGYLALSALDWISAATMGFLFYTYPAWVALFAVVRRTEHVDARRAIALGISLAGIVFMVGAPWAAPIAWQGVALALAAALTYALYVPFLHTLERETSASIASTFVAGGAGIVCLAIAAGTGALTIQLAPVAWAAIAGLAILCTVIAFMTFMRGLATLGPVRTAIISTVEPFWTALLGAVALRQSLTVPTLVGGALIAVAVLLLQMPGRTSIPVERPV